MVQFKIANDIAWVTLQRPQKQNALSFDMFKQLDKIIKIIRSNHSIRAVVLQGEGEHFCAGLDVKSVTKHPSQIIKLLAKILPGNQNLVQRVVLGWRTLPIPVYATLQGNCLGGGLHIALGADFRIATSNTQVAIMESRWGLCPDMGTSVILPSYIRQDHALLLAMNAERINAQRAQELGLITTITDEPKKYVEQQVDSLRQHSPDALAAIKLLYNRAYQQPSRKLLWLETWYQIKLLCSKNTRIAMRNGVEESDTLPYQKRMRWK
ncbi:crotonase/enoyl-CoA hydratase family protein [Pseudoalteromonas luteoviolacea]|uniref:crotonase/enoyl-CoA hydratase family protein n=1 Tax=Pseudoalteromonas luteoviolacea TaxID=43657 RepID=UPI001EEEADB5|nr:crotonase/enoyl-CoA hydratase family protein [Pseudoalteromonas luteoviolacea]MCF6437957.1 crotonase/enoyl-CoA hydratase family protein [Pseudoalteromonas luteoviolacea]